MKREEHWLKEERYLPKSMLKTHTKVNEASLSIYKFVSSLWKFYTLSLSELLLREYMSTNHYLT